MASFERRPDKENYGQCIASSIRPLCIICREFHCVPMHDINTVYNRQEDCPKPQVRIRSTFAIISQTFT